MIKWAILANFPCFINKSLSFGNGSFRTQEFCGLAKIDTHLLEMIIILPTSFEFNFSKEEKVKGYFNLMDYFPQLFRGAENKIAIVTYMNGKNTTNESWKIMGRSISGAIPEGVMTIGVYNETNDLKGAIQQKNQTEEENAISLSKFFMEKKELFNKVCKDAKILHICDKQAERIYNAAFELLSNEGKEWVKKHIYVLSINPLEGIIENSCIHAFYYNGINRELGDFLVFDFSEKIYQSDFQKDLMHLQKKVGFYELPSVILLSSSK
jgi:hypothetical protein